MNSVIAFPIRDQDLASAAPSTNQCSSVPAEAISRQLSRILQSDGFARARRMRRFLEFIVEETVAGRAAQLCEYSIGISVFERDASFEPGLDPIVRNDARRLRNKLLEYYQLDHRQDQVVIDVPKGGYVPVFRRASASRKRRSDSRYRLCVSLIRVADGSEILSKAYDVDAENCSLELQFSAPNLPSSPRRYRRPVSSISGASSAAAPSVSHFTTFRSSTQIE